MSAWRLREVLAFFSELSVFDEPDSEGGVFASASGLDTVPFFPNAGLRLDTSVSDSSCLALVFSAFVSSSLAFPFPFPFPFSFASSSFPFVLALPQSRNPETFGFRVGLSSLVLGLNFGLSSCFSVFSVFTVAAGLGSSRGAGATSVFAGGGASAAGLPIYAVDRAK